MIYLKKIQKLSFQKSYQIVFLKPKACKFKNIFLKIIFNYDNKLGVFPRIPSSFQFLETSWDPGPKKGFKKRKKKGVSSLEIKN